MLFHHFKLRGVYRFLPVQRHAVLCPHGLKLHILIGIGLVGSSNPPVRGRDRRPHQQTFPVPGCACASAEGWLKWNAAAIAIAAGGLEHQRRLLNKPFSGADLDLAVRHTIRSRPRRTTSCQCGGAGAENRGIISLVCVPLGHASIRIVHWIVKSMHLKHHHLEPDFAWSYLSDAVAAGSTGSITHGGAK